MTQSTIITAYIGLGSNLANPIHQINQARQAITALAETEELAFSSLYASSPMGPQDQPDYVNAVMAIATKLSAVDLLRSLQAIEQQQGRVRTGMRWGARTLDLDLLLYGEQQIELPDLIVPHLGISQRAFVLYPLQEIAPALVIPRFGRLSQLIEHCPLAGLKKLP
jgi:2-amino-4-hydroxy-6-hydroxymethyldihydropteridine diphosphokinase